MRFSDRIVVGLSSDYPRIDKEMCFMLHCFECDGMGHEVNGTKKGFSCCLGLYSLLEKQSGFPPFALAIEV